MAAAGNVQRRLDFPVMKNSRTRSKAKKENLENVPQQTTTCGRQSSPRKRLGDAENIPVVSSSKSLNCSPSKMQKENVGTLKNQKDSETPIKRIQTPVKNCRTSLFCEKASPVLKLQRPESYSYQRAKQVLNTAKPERLVCREKETTEIRQFLEHHLSKKSGGSLYISGAPGTGKTAILTHLLDDLQGEHECRTVYLNCMMLRDSNSVYNQVLIELTGKANILSTKDATKCVTQSITKTKKNIVLILDEIDQLDSKNQEVLYTIFEWPVLPKSKLILVGIANALDLTDRILPRLQARPKCKPQLMNFAPYSKDQISAIIEDRLQELVKDGLVVIEPSAIQFCARKVSAVAGDMRKALDVCRRAVELVEADIRSQTVLQVVKPDTNSPVKHPHFVPKKIGVVQIMQVLSEVYTSRAASIAHGAESVPLQQKLVVCTLLLMQKLGKTKEVTQGKLHEMYCKICKKRMISSVDQSEFFSLCNLLEARGVLSVKKSKDARSAKVTLKFDENELEHALQDKVLITSIMADGLPK